MDCGLQRACTELVASRCGPDGAERERGGGRKIGRRARRDDLSSFVASWSEKDVIDGEVCDAFVLILRTRGCAWARASGCSFCGYIGDSSDEVTEAHLDEQLSAALERFRGQPFFKIYTSGSFLDDEEVPPAFQRRVLEGLPARGTRRLLVETLPRFATEEKVGGLVDAFKGGGGSDVELALGLESATPSVLRHSVNKPARVEDFLEAAGTARRLGARVRMYVVIGPPLLSEGESLEDAVISARAVRDVANTVSFNPINVQRGTLVERLWRRGEFRPPWLWTVVEVLRRTADLGPRVMSGPTGGGTPRGAHNCGRCDKRVMGAIERFSLSGETSDLDGVECPCRGQWLDQLELEDRVHGPFPVERTVRRKG